MAAGGGKRGKLKPRQQRAIRALLTAGSVAEAAEQAYREALRVEFRRRLDQARAVLDDVREAARSMVSIFEDEVAALEARRRALRLD